MSDVEAIQRHKGLYVHLVDATSRVRDEGMLDQLEALFTKDALAEYGWATFKSGREIREYFGRPARKTQMAWVWHAVHSPVIEVEGDRARARWTLYAMHASPERPADIVTTFGRYDDEYVRTPDGWKMARLRFVNETPKG